MFINNRYERRQTICTEARGDNKTENLSWEPEIQTKINSTIQPPNHPTNLYEFIEAHLASFCIGEVDHTQRWKLQLTGVGDENSDDIVFLEINSLT